MKSIRSILLSGLFILIFGTLASQPGQEALDRVYGLDPLLYNGIKYTYFLPQGTGGHQYLQSPDYFPGSVTIKEETFEGITLNYDIYNQHLLLRYADEQGAFNIIQVSRAWLRGFRLGEMRFEQLEQGDGKRFYQVLGNETVKMLFYWHKSLNLDVLATTTNYTFTPPFRSSYVLMDGQLKPFRNKKGLMALFGKEHRQEINKYIRKNRIKLNKASDRSMTDLINFINGLL